MTLNNFDNSVYTVETALSGHPDKVCDQICDAILDNFLVADPTANVTVECMGSGNTLFIGGEVASSKSLDIEDIALATYKSIGYSDGLNIINTLHHESTQTNSPIKNGEAGDQGVMYGYACKSEFNFLPYGVYLVNAIAKEIDLCRHDTNAYLPDGKVQITLGRGQIDSLVVCVQHTTNADLESIKALILKRLYTLFPEINTSKRVFFNHNSNFINGGFLIDAGLSGRKIVADTYCGIIPNGGGSFSGKDPFRLDRSGAYMARYVAKNMVANGFTESCLISLAYVFGYEHPVMVDVSTGDTNNDKKILLYIKERFDFRPPAIVERLNLYNEKYLPAATYGHFTNPNYSWEKIIAL
jgi:S-adenosylmethionine synthetase